MKIGLSLGVNQPQRNPNTGIERHFIFLDGVDDYYQLDTAITVDRIRMDVFPSAGNTGLPTGAPAVTNGQMQRIDFAYSGTLADIGKNGTDFFAGCIANLELVRAGSVIYENPLNSDLLSTQFANTIPEPEV